MVRLRGSIPQAFACGRERELFLLGLFEDFLPQRF